MLDVCDYDGDEGLCVVGKLGYVFEFEVFECLVKDVDGWVVYVMLY